MNNNSNKLVYIGLGLAAAGTLGYFGWRYYQKKKDAGNTLPELPDLPALPEPNNNNNNYTPAPTPKPQPNTSGFPLKRGSRGDKVRAFQEALIQQHGKTILPKYGADGQFGSEMTAALKKLNLPATIDESTYNIMVRGNSPAGSDPQALAKKLYDAALKKDFNAAIQHLKMISSPEEYLAVGEAFKQWRLGAVRQTLVNGMLNAFNSESQKQQIRLEFNRMGLKFDGSKWALAGIGSLQLITHEPCTVWCNGEKVASVPAKVVLGVQTGQQAQYTLFEHKGVQFAVPTRSVRYF
jgi:hypothetical protein